MPPHVRKFMSQDHLNALFIPLVRIARQYDLWAQDAPRCEYCRVVAVE
jgi:hypothetical protein